VLPDLTQYLWIAWLVLALLFVIIEMATLEFTFLMLGTGTLIGGLGLNLLGAPWWAQVLGAAVVSALLLFTIRPLLLRLLRRSSTLHHTNVDALVGMSARAVGPFVDGDGSARLDNGETWTARLVDAAHGTDDRVQAGTRLTVTAVRGATVDVTPAQPAPPQTTAASDPSTPEGSTS